MTVASLESRLGAGVLGVSWSDALAAMLAFGFLVPLAASDGGYRPNAWGWTALVASWLAMLALAIARGARPGRLELAALGLLAAFAGWILGSAVWTSSTTRTMLESERAFAYVAVLAAILLLVRPASARSLLGGTWAAVSLVALYALGTRLFPERLGSFDPLARYRLAEPLGYWNALGVLAAIGALLALGLAARAGSRIVCGLAGASLVVLLATQYFTFGRGPWLALGAGLVAAIALDRRRLQLIATLLALAPWPALGLLLASRSDALTREDAPLAAASHDGHRLALLLSALAAAGGLAALGMRALERRLQIGPRARTVFATALIVIAGTVLASIFVQYGSPTTIAHRAYSAFKVPEPSAGADLNARLFDLSGNGRDLEWRVAWQDHELHPWLGSGAGTYEQSWLRLRRVSAHARDAHNLYLEVLAELGPFGLALLVAALAVPVAAGFAARRSPLTAVALGAYVVFLAHAAVDWDWEMPAVTLTGLCCAAVLLVSARRQELVLTPRFRAAGLAAVAAVAAFALVAAVGNSAIVSSEDAVLARDWTKAAAEARKARAWMPWSAEPWRHLGEAQLGLGRLAEARASFRKALAKEPRDWSLWYDLALVTRGREQAQAVAQAKRLDPLGSEVEQLQEELGQ